MRGSKFPLAIGSVIITLALVVCFAGETKWHQLNAGIGQTILGLLFVAWLIGPPLWFLWEWHNYNGENFNQFKYGQELARNLWSACRSLWACEVRCSFYSLSGFRLSRSPRLKFSLEYFSS
jgi:hypothetical protein